MSEELRIQIIDGTPGQQRGDGRPPPPPPGLGAPTPYGGYGPPMATPGAAPPYQPGRAPPGSSTADLEAQVRRVIDNPLGSLMDVLDRQAKQRREQAHGPMPARGAPDYARDLEWLRGAGRPTRAPTATLPEFQVPGRAAPFRAGGPDSGTEALGFRGPPGGAGGAMANIGRAGAAEGAAAGGAGEAAAFGGAEMAGAAAGGPIGIAVMAVAMVVKKAEEGMRQAVETAGRAATTIASLDAGGVARGFGEVAEKIPLFGKAVNEATKQALAFGQAVDGTARRLAPFHGGLAAAQANSDVADVLGDIRRSQIAGNELADWVKARSQLENRVQDDLAKALKAILPLATRFLENTSARLEAMETALGKVAEIVAGIDERAVMIAGQINPLFGSLLKWLKEVAENTRKNEAEGPAMLDELLALEVDKGLVDREIRGLWETKRRRDEAPAPAPAFDF